MTDDARSTVDNAKPQSIESNAPESPEKKASETGSDEEVVQFMVKMGPFTCRPLKSGWLAVGVDGQEKLGMPVEAGQVVTLEVREGR